MKDFISWLATYLGIEKTPTATITISFLVFFLGIFINEIIKAIGKSKERKNYKQLLLLNYLAFKNYLFVQSASLFVYKDQISLDNRTDFEIYIHPNSAINSFEEIGYTNTYKALFLGLNNWKRFNRGSKIRSFALLYEIISSISNIQNKIFPLFLKYDLEIKSFKEKIEKSDSIAFESLRTLTNKLLVRETSRELSELFIALGDKRHQFFSSKQLILDKLNYYSEVDQILVQEQKIITGVMHLKELLEVQKNLYNAVTDIKSMHNFVNIWRSTSQKAGENFKYEAKRLSDNHRILFGKLKG